LKAVRESVGSQVSDGQIELRVPEMRVCLLKSIERICLSRPKEQNNQLGNEVNDSLVVPKVGTRKEDNDYERLL